MAIRLYETKMEFDYDSSDGSVKTTHIVYIESDGLYFDGTIYGTETSSGATDGITIDSTVATDSTGLNVGDFEINHERIAFGKHQLFTKADGSGVVFTGTLGTTLDSVEAAPHALGSISGFAVGGFTDGFPKMETIDKFPFAISGGTATDVGDLGRYPSATTDDMAGHSSSTDGFVSGGSPGYSDKIDKFPFSITSGAGTGVGSLAAGRSTVAGHYSTTDGFTSGGFSSPPSIYYSQIDKFPFSISGGTATDVGDLSLGRSYITGHTSSTNGFTSGGYNPAETPSPLYSDRIDKFPFSISSGTATDVGDLSNEKGRAAGLQSASDGFNAGGFDTPGSTYNTNIDKFPFSISSGISTVVGDLFENAEGRTAQSSTTDGFVSGGYVPVAPQYPTYSRIEKFPYSITSGATTNAGNLTAGRAKGTGHQD